MWGYVQIVARWALLQFPEDCSSESTSILLSSAVAGEPLTSFSGAIETIGRSGPTYVKG
jgi:hypothetical protein